MGSVSIGIPIFCVSSELPTIKWQVFIRCFKEVFNALLLKATLSLELFSPVCTIAFGNTNKCSISTFKNKINKITLPFNQFIMRKCGAQSTKVICCIRFRFLLSIDDANIFHGKINILEYPEFVVI